MTVSHHYETLNDAQAGRCALGDHPLPEERYATRVDHILRRKDGGSDEMDNLRLICLECDWDREDNRPNAPKPMLFALYKDYKTLQQAAGDIDRKLKAFDGTLRGTTKSPYVSDSTRDVLETMRDLGAELTKEQDLILRRAVRLEPEWGAFMKEAPGVTELTAAFLLGRVDIRKADTVSALWRYLGFDHTEKTASGKKNPSKGKIKAILYSSVGGAMLRKTSPYRADYDRIKAKYEAQDKKGHYLALSQCIKLWLSHLWEAWREYEGLPTGDPYAFSQQGHDKSHFIHRTERGWEV